MAWARCNWATSLRRSVEVNFTANEMLINVICRRGVCVCVPVHETAPRTPHGPDIQKNRTIQISCALKGSVPQGYQSTGWKIARLRYADSCPLRWLGLPWRTTRSHYRDQTKQQNDDLLAHAKSDSVGSE